LSDTILSPPREKSSDRGCSVTAPVQAEDGHRRPSQPFCPLSFLSAAYSAGGEGQQAPRQGKHENGASEHRDSPRIRATERTGLSGHSSRAGAGFADRGYPRDCILRSAETPISAGRLPAGPPHGLRSTPTALRASPRKLRCSMTPTPPRFVCSPATLLIAVRGPAVGRRDPPAPAPGLLRGPGFAFQLPRRPVAGQRRRLEPPPAHRPRRPATPTPSSRPTAQWIAFFVETATATTTWFVMPAQRRPGEAAHLPQARPTPWSAGRGTRKRVTFSSGAAAGCSAASRALYDVPLDGGPEQPLPTDWGTFASYSPGRAGSSPITATPPRGPASTTAGRTAPTCGSATLDSKTSRKLLDTNLPDDQKPNNFWPMFGQGRVVLRLRPRDAGRRPVARR